MDTDAVARCATEAADALTRLSAVMPRPKPKFARSLEILHQLGNVDGDLTRVPNSDSLPKLLESAFGDIGTSGRLSDRVVSEGSLESAIRLMTEAKEKNEIPLSSDFPPLVREFLKEWAIVNARRGGRSKSAKKSQSSRMRMKALNLKRAQKLEALKQNSG